jgi:hypothetical protein
MDLSRTRWAVVEDGSVVELGDDKLEVRPF